MTKENEANIIVKHLVHIKFIHHIIIIIITIIIIYYYYYYKTKTIRSNN